MPFIGNKPSAVPLTSADIADSIITSAKIVDGTIVNADINASAAIDASKLTGAGISMAQQWRITADLTGSADPISSNLEIVDTDGYGGIGSAMTESSGTFTFPSTGIYFINFNILQRTITTADYCQGIIKTTTNNSTYDAASDGRTNSSSSGTAFSSTSTSFIFDVTDVTTHKVRFQIIQAEATNTLLGSTANNLTYMTFIRLGDT
jgi:hypothetical protein